MSPMSASQTREALSPVRQSPHELSVEPPASEPEWRLLEAAAGALEGGQAHGVDVPGIDPLRERIAELLRDPFGVESAEPQRGVVTATVQPSRFLTIQMT